jgi:hypothetical protein
MRALVILVALAGIADARPSWSRLGGGAQLHYELSTLHDVKHDPQMAASPQDLILGGARLHGFVGGKRWGYHLGLDLAAGQTARPYSYLAYDVSFFPVGIALRFAQTSFITIGGGIGAQGAVGTLDDAMTLPLELRFELGRATRILGRVRANTLFHTDRQAGAISTSSFDELEASLGLRLGRAYNEWGFPTGDGYFVAANYREALGARYVGITLGFSIDMGTYRTARPRDDGCRFCD